MKKKLFLSIVILISLVASPFIIFNTTCLLLGNLSPSRIGYLQIREEKSSYTYFKSYESEYIEIDTLPEYLKSFVVGLEDQKFYKHNGYDIKRILSSFISNTSAGEIVSGGSTITQQLARLLYLDNSKSYMRKLKELILARRLENGLSKDQILELYLNEVYFGDNLYGINSASHSYFNKSADKLNKNEALLLFSLLPAPNSYSPRINLELAQKVYSTAALNLLKRKVINQIECDDLLNNFPAFNQTNDITSNSSWYNQSIYEYLKLNNIDIDHSNIIANSLKDSFVQNTLENIISNVDINDKTDIGIIVLEPKSGNVLGIIGGKNKDNFNRVLSTSKAIGSVIKPVLYTIALENGFTPTSTFESKPVTFYLDTDLTYSPSNNNNLYANRKINMIEALALSDNIYATKTILVLGTKRLSERLKTIGIDVEPNVTNALGSFSLTLLQLASIYNALANNGIYNSPRFINSYNDGKKTYEIKNRSFTMFENKSSRIMSYMLLSTQDKALKTYTTPTMLYNKPNQRFGIKTGSTASSSFVIGYNPYYTIAVYSGSDDNSQLTQSGLSKKLFKTIADRLMEHQKDIYFSTTNLKPFYLYNSITDTKSFTYYK